MYCTGDPDPSRTDLYNDDLKTLIPGAEPTGPCLAGYYCDPAGGSSNPKQNMVTPGHWSDEGATQEEDCEAGTYQSEYGQPKYSDTDGNCPPCPLGKYCPTGAMSAPTDCDPGHYCGPVTKQTEMTACPEGTYSPLRDLQKEEDCWDCKAGWYCQGEGNAAPDGECAAGHFCGSRAITATPTGYTDSGTDN